MVKKIHECEDEKVLKYIIKDKDFDKNLDKENIKLLWECCQIPDFVKNIRSSSRCGTESVFGS